MCVGMCIDMCMAFLHEDEAMYLKSLDPRSASPLSDVLIWALRILRREMNEGSMKPPIYRAFESKIMVIRDLFDDLLAFTAQPIPVSCMRARSWRSRSVFFCAFVCAHAHVHT